MLTLHIGQLTEQISKTVCMAVIYIVLNLEVGGGGNKSNIRLFILKLFLGDLGKIIFRDKR